MNPLRRAAFALALVAIALPASAQLGPYSFVTDRAAFEASIVKRDKDFLWIQRTTEDGSPGPQIGIAVKDIKSIRVPSPSLFAAVDRLRLNPAATDSQFAQAHAALDKFILQMKGMRDIPGIPADEAILLKGKLYDRKGLWTEALRQYEDVLLKGQKSALTTDAQILAGIAYERNGDHNSAVEYLGGLELPEEDEELLSNLLFALGDAYFALGNYDNALLSYLPLVVFYPYVFDNESRGMAKAIACYAQLKEWEPLYRTIQEIKANYPGSPAEKTADELIGEFQKELSKAGLVMDGTKIVEDATQNSIAGTTVDYSKPEEIEQAP